MSPLNKFRIIAIVGFLIAGASAQTLQSSHTSSFKPPVPATTTRAAAPSKAVARINGVAITEAAFDAELKRVFPSFSLHGNGVPKEYEPAIREKALGNLIDTELAYQEAKRRNLPITPAEWQQRVAEISKDYGSKAQFDREILKLFGSRAAFEATLKHDMLLDKIFLVEVKQKATVSDAEVQKYYEQNKAQFIQPESITYQSISAMFPKNATPEEKKAARARIEKLLSQAKAAKDREAFGVLAEKASEDEFRVMMGEHKMVHVQTVAPEFQFVFSMKEGQISDIVESPAGFHIVRLEKRQPQKSFKFVELRTSLKEMLTKEKLRARNKEFHEGLRKAAKIEIVKG